MQPGSDRKPGSDVDSVGEDERPAAERDPGAERGEPDDARIAQAVHALAVANDCRIDPETGRLTGCE